MEMAVRELQKFYLKLRTQRLKLYATQARQSIAAILAESSLARPGPVGGNAKRELKTLKEFVVF